MNGFHCFLAILGLVLLPALCTSQDTFTRSRSTFYGSPDCYGNPTGACGRIWKDRKRWSSIYLQLQGITEMALTVVHVTRCIYAPHSSNDGVNVVVTDHGAGLQETELTSSSVPEPIRTKLANSPASTEILFAYGVVDPSEFYIPCQYSSPTLVFKVHEHSKFPLYLAIVIQYVSGQNDITAVELWQEDCKEWRGMCRAFGAVWDLPSPPSGSIDLRFQLSGSAGLQWVQASKAIPSDWKAGAAYASAIQLP